MFCQKCRTPLRPDTSLDDLNPAAFNLLVDAATAADRAASDPASQPLYSKQQKALYNSVSSQGSSPTFKRVITPARNGTTDHPTSNSPSDHSTPAQNHNHNHPAMSFVMLTDSQVVPPPKSIHARNPYASSTSSPRRTSTGSKRASFDSHSHSNLLSHKMSTTTALYTILSSRSDIDHPICTECTDLLLAGLEKRLAISTRERDAYADFLRDAIADVPTEEEAAETLKELEKTKAQEATALKELENLEKEKERLEAEYAALEKEARDLDEEEATFWRSRNAFAAELATFQAERDSVNVRYDHDARQLERLQRTNVYNDTFCISHNGYFGTINNLRLGRLAGHGIEWAEINAAWGMTCLLLVTVAERLNFKFQGYRLNPMGSTSTIDRITDSSAGSVASSTRDIASSRLSTGSISSASTKAPTQTLPLHYSSDLPLGIGGFLHRNFDNGMVAFLECVRQLGGHVERTTSAGSSAATAASPSAKISSRDSSNVPATQGSSPGLRLPYSIVKDKIGDVSIKLGTFGSSGGDEAWTKACKLTLTCCKFLLAHASNVGGGGGSAGHNTGGESLSGAPTSRAGRTGG